MGLSGSRVWGLTALLSPVLYAARPRAGSVFVKGGQVCPVGHRGERRSRPASQYSSPLIVWRLVIDIREALCSDLYRDSPVVGNQIERVRMSP